MLNDHQTHRSGALLLVDISPAAAFHLVTAIRKHRLYLAAQYLPVPGELIELQKMLDLRVREGQRGTALPQSEDVREPTAMTPQLLTYEQAAVVLSCSARQIKRLVAAGDLTPVRVGSGLVRLRVTDIDRYVAGLRDAHESDQTKEGIQ